MAKSLNHFAVVPGGEGYILQIEDEEGEMIELSVSYEQLDLIAEAIDEQLDRDADRVEGVDEEEEEPSA